MIVKKPSSDTHERSGCFTTPPNPIFVVEMVDEVARVAEVPWLID
jgi:hypothetical protein